MRRIAILGSTGSIGRSALSVIRSHPDRLQVVALAAGANAVLFAEQIQQSRPAIAAMGTAAAVRRLEFGRQDWRPEQIESGAAGLVAVATHPDADIVLCASSGSAGLEAVLAAIDAGKTIALANKEVLVMAGALVTAAARRRGVRILPVDSEHNAIHQCLEGRAPGDVRRLILTASGGPFRGRTIASLGSVGPDDALRHPTWRMGRKITIDSATLMNKGLEVIEAHWLFGVTEDRIDVVIHPQSVVHSMVEFIDGSLLAQLGVTDMRLPIQYAFSYPERWGTDLAPLDLTRCGPLDFQQPDRASFPCLSLAYRALAAVETGLPAVLNAANELAVAEFLAGRLAFTAIPEVIARTMAAYAPAPVGTLADVRAVDGWARTYSQDVARGLELKIEIRIVQTLLAFVFVLGVLIFVHELGHYLMAKRLGVRVLKFSLGFGPRLIGFRRGDTDYCISAIPLGGFVKMAGENPEDPRTGATDEFLSRSKWERFQILIMGPLMNIALAVVLMASVLMQGADVPAYQDQPPVVGAVMAGSPAERGGIRPEDRIVSVGGRRTETWDEFYTMIGTRARRSVAIVLLREGHELTVQVTPEADAKYEIGDIGVMPDVHPHIRAVTVGDPADEAGLKAGDLVLAVNGETMVFSRQLSNAIATRTGQPVVFTIERGGVRQDITVTPVKRGSRGVVGIGIGDEVKSIQPTPLQAVWLSLQRNYEFSGLIIQTLVGLLTTETSPRQLMGPVGIAQLSGESAAAGWLALFTLMASISLNLGILNLLPIPVLDGGHIFIMAVEGLARRDFSVKVKEKMLLAGFALLMLLMVTVIYNDLTRVPWVEKLMFWR